MYIFKATNNKKAIDYEHWSTLEAAFKNCENEYVNDTDPQVPYSVAWAENDSGNYEMWIISHSDTESFSNLAKFTPYEVIKIEVF